jgi:hypothetical protein
MDDLALHVEQDSSRNETAAGVIPEEGLGASATAWGE